jgi:hypothetical protein
LSPQKRTSRHRSLFVLITSPLGLQAYAAGRPLPGTKDDRVFVGEAKAFLPQKGHPISALPVPAVTFVNHLDICFSS